MTGDTLNFEDTILIYFSSEDDCWTGHSLRTDQIGMGDDIVTALADVMKAVDQVRALASEDETLAYLREAPPEIQRLAVHAKPLPGELYEIAHHKARGEWPVEVPVEVKPDSKEAFIAKAEPVAC
jgi:hypothetical protein